MCWVKLIYRPLVAGTARHVLVGRNRTSASADRGRFTRADVALVAGETNRRHPTDFVSNAGRRVHRVWSLLASALLRSTSGKGAALAFFHVMTRVLDHGRPTPAGVARMAMAPLLVSTTAVVP